MENLSRRLDETDERVSDVRTIVVGPKDEGEQNGLRSKVQATEKAFQEFRQNDKFLKWGIVALIAMKSPDIWLLIKPLLLH
jgi:hypothetical protein